MASTDNSSLTVVPLTGMPEVRPGDDLAALLWSAAQSSAAGLEAGDVVVVAQKIVSKAEGARVSLASVDPSPMAREWAEAWNHDPRLVEVVLRESVRIVKMARGLIVSETRHGFICANAGVDASNSGEEDMAILLPREPDRSAEQLRDSLGRLAGCDLAVIVADSFGRPWRQGVTQVAVGSAGLAPIVDLRGERDADGRMLHGTLIALADQLADAADLVCGKSSRIPAAVVRNYRGPRREGSAKELLRLPEEDLFR